MLNVQHSYAVLGRTDSDAIRREQYLGTTHLVVPVVALVEKVLHASNAQGPELALASEFGKFPAGWDGRPVVLDHPELDGVKVSANIPEILEAEAFGQLFNTKVEGGKLKTEAWINLDRVSEMDTQTQNTISSIENGEVTEVSTGLFTALDPAQGRFNGETYTGIWRNVVPDHLAILPEGTIGACSVADGCGTPRLNKSPDSSEGRFPEAPSTEPHSNAVCSCGGTCGREYTELNMATATQQPSNTEPTAAATKTTGEADGHTHTYDDTNGGTTSETDDHTHTYAFGSTSTGETDGHSHSLNGFANVSVNKSGLTGQEQVVLGNPAGETSDPPGKKPSIMSVLTDNMGTSLKKLASVFSFRDNQRLSDVDIRSALTAGLSEIDDDDSCWGFDIIAVFESDFVYAIWGFEGPLLFRRSFDISDGDGAVTISSDKVQVRPVTEFVPVNVTRENEMSDKKKVDALIANAATRYNEEDRGWLSALEDAQLDKLDPAEPKAATSEPVSLSAADISKAVADGLTEALKGLKTPPAGAAAPQVSLLEEDDDAPGEGSPGPATLEAFLGTVPDEFRGALEESVQMRKQRHDKLVKGLVANSRCEFSQDELQKMSLQELIRLGKLANVQPDYSGKGSGGEGLHALRPAAGADDQNVIPAAEEPFPRTARKSEAA